MSHTCFKLDLIEQKLLDCLKYENDSSAVIMRMTDMNFSIDDICAAFDSLAKNGLIREMIVNRGWNGYDGKIGFWEATR